MQRARRHPGRVQQPHRLRGDERRLLGRLGDHAVTGRERGADLADEDREREIPRRDADERAAAAIGQLVGFPGGSGHWSGLERAAQLASVIAAEIGRLADLRDRILERLAGLALQQRDEARPPGLQRVRGLLEHCGPAFARRCRPRRKAGGGRRHRRNRNGFIALDDNADGRALDR